MFQFGQIWNSFCQCFSKVVGRLHNVINYLRNWQNLNIFTIKKAAMVWNFCLVGNICQFLVHRIRSPDFHACSEIRSTPSCPQLRFVLERLTTYFHGKKILNFHEFFNQCECFGKKQQIKKQYLFNWSTIRENTRWAASKLV